jgi:hypothetical protein
MKNWTDKVINWHQLPGVEVQRLIATWGKSPAEIAKYDKKHGFKNEPAVVPHVSNTKNPVDFPKAPAKKAPAKKAVAKAPTRQKHTGADGEVKFVEHRNLFVGFYGGKVVVTKRTAEACKEVLRTQFNLEV